LFIITGKLFYGLGFVKVRLDRCDHVTLNLVVCIFFQCSSLIMPPEA